MMPVTEPVTCYDEQEYARIVTVSITVRI